MAVTETHGLTIADLESMPDDGRTYELLGGTIVVNAAPTPRHQRASRELQQLLIAGCPAGHEVFDSPIALDLPGEQRVEPDLVIVPQTSVGEERLALPVLLLVELLSPSTVHWDTIAKRDAYAAAGVEHYWMLDTRPDRERFVALRLRDGSYETVLDRTDRIVTTEPVAIDVTVADLFAPPA